MATFSLVHGAWHGGWAWDLAARRARGARPLASSRPICPCDDVDGRRRGVCGRRRDALGGVDDAIVVGHSLGGLTIALVPARLHVYPLRARRRDVDRSDAFVSGFGDARIRDELGRSYYPDPARRRARAPVSARARVARARSFAGRRRSPTRWRERPGRPPTSSARATPRFGPTGSAASARDGLGVEPVELDAGHSPMLSHPRELAAMLDRPGAGARHRRGGSDTSDAARVV